MINTFKQLTPHWQVTILIAIFTAVSVPIHLGQPSADLFALYFASLNFGAGDVAAVYPDPKPMYQLSVPDSWDAQATALGIVERPLFPFIYPPIWAAMFAPVTKVLSPQVFALFGNILNPILLGLCAVLAYRVMRPKMTMALWVLIGLIFVGTTSFGYVALSQNQPQIFVSMLIILAIERSRSGHDLAAGAVMALAASIKLYPVLFALIWLASRNYRALSAFLAVGGALGFGSILIAGWPLHQEFLDQIKIIAHSFISCQICMNVDATLTQWVMSTFLVEEIGIRDPDASEVVNVVVSVKPQLYRTLDRVFMVAALAALYFAATRASETRLYRSIWPATFIAVALFSPLTWSYHYLPVALLAPALIENAANTRCTT